MLTNLAYSNKCDEEEMLEGNAAKAKRLPARTVKMPAGRSAQSCIIYDRYSAAADGMASRLDKTCLPVRP